MKKSIGLFLLTILGVLTTSEVSSWPSKDNRLGESIYQNIEKQIDELKPLVSIKQGATKDQLVKVFSFISLIDLISRLECGNKEGFFESSFLASVKENFFELKKELIDLLKQIPKEKIVDVIRYNKNEVKKFRKLVSSLDLVNDMAEMVVSVFGGTWGKLKSAILSKILSFNEVLLKCIEKENERVLFAQTGERTRIELRLKATNKTQIFQALICIDFLRQIHSIYQEIHDAKIDQFYKNQLNQLDQNEQAAVANYGLESYTFKQRVSDLPAVMKDVAVYGAVCGSLLLATAFIERYQMKKRKRAELINWIKAEKRDNPRFSPEDIKQQIDKGWYKFFKPQEIDTLVNEL